MIGMLLETEYPKDIRVRKEAESLVDGGVDVLVIVPWREGEKRSEIVNGVHVERIGRNMTYFRRGIHDMISALFFVNWTFYFKVPKLIKKYDVKHLHIHDLALAKTGYKLKSKIEGKVILDSHENYPELLATWFLTKKGFVARMKNKLLFTPNRWRRYEKRIMPKMDKIIVVIDEMKDKFIERYGFEESKMCIISNYEKKSFANDAMKMGSDNEFTFDPEIFYIIYVGGIGPIRGVDDVIRGVNLLKSRGKKVKFLILGSGNSAYLSELDGIVESEGLQEEVQFLGYKPFEVVNYYMQKADVNIIPHKRTGHTDHTIPHKIFQIFLSKAPLLVSSCKPLKRMIDECDGGWVYESSDENSLAESVEEIMNSSPELKSEKIERAYQLAMTKYNWDLEGEKLVRFYNDLS